MSPHGPRDQKYPYFKRCIYVTSPCARCWNFIIKISIQEIKYVCAVGIPNATRPMVSGLVILILEMCFSYRY